MLKPRSRIVPSLMLEMSKNYRVYVGINEVVPKLTASPSVTMTRSITLSFGVFSSITSHFHLSFKAMIN